MRFSIAVLATFSTVLLAQGPGGRPGGKAGGKKGFVVTAGGLAEGAVIPKRFGCDGAGVSLPLAWSGEPEGTKSFALIVDDPDARDFNHWLVWDIPASVHAVAEGAEPQGVSGMNDFGKAGYGAPCPPEGRGPHTYSFRLYALDVPTLELKARAHRDALEKALKKHVLGKSEARLQYGR